MSVPTRRDFVVGLLASSMVPVAASVIADGIALNSMVHPISEAVVDDLTTANFVSVGSERYAFSYCDLRGVFTIIKGEAQNAGA